MDFHDLGLTTNEAKTYEAMLRLGKASASQISKDSEVPYGRIYTVLASLEEKGLIKIIPESTKKYVASSPDMLHSYVEEKINSLKKIEDKIKEYKVIYEENAHEPVIIATGKNNFAKVSKEQVKTRNYAYSIKYKFSIRPAIIRGTTENIKKGIDIRSLGRFDEETKSNLRVWYKIHKKIKPIPNDGIALEIKDDQEVTIGLMKNNTTMLINDAPFAKLMKELFLCYYETHDEKGKKTNWKK